MAKNKWKLFKQVVLRKRIFKDDQLESGNLRRCLTGWDLTGIGLGSTLGVGIYVLVGAVGLKIAGPSIVLSFLIAAVASLFAGLCYAEFGSRVPRAGSAYIYAYVTVGELLAYLIGWNMILDGLFAPASVAKGLSIYIDSISGYTMSTWFTSVMPISNGEFFSSYFDLLGFMIVLVFGVMLAFGVRESSWVSNIFVILNMSVILFIIIAGAFKANPGNWDIPQSDVPAGFGTGGFFPYGVMGMLKGAALCFSGFIGFDSISATSEEVRDPRRTIPSAILTVLVIVFFAYASVSTVVTMMVPYFLLDKVAAVATAFTYVDWDWARWIVSVGAIFGIFASLYGAMLPLPRLLYAMASDGLLGHWFARVSSNRQSPVLATILPTCIIAVLTAIVELHQLILMMCIGTLLSYTIVAACVIFLRYKSDYISETRRSYIKQLFGCGDKQPSKTTAKIVNITLLIFIVVCISTALVAVHVDQPLIPVSILHAVALVLLMVMTLQPQAKEQLVFKTPLVPVVPCLSIYVNIHLMILVNIQTWIRIIMWIIIGIPIYLLCIYFYKRKKNNLQDNMTFAHENKNGKAPVKIIVESPTPPDTIRLNSNHRGDQTEQLKIENEIQMQEKVRNYGSMTTDDIIVQQAVIENNEEKEAKIIDLLDQVLQAEEDSYEEIISLKEVNDEDISIPITNETIPHRKSLSELSDAGSDASLGNQGLSKYDVIAQVHREDLPKLNEEEEKVDKVTEDDNDNKEGVEYEQVTAFNDSETNSRTDESGYSDTLDRNALNGSTEDTREEASYIPPPPPLDESFFANAYYFGKTYSAPIDYSDTVDKTPSNRFSEDIKEEASNIPAPPPPPPPPLDESFFANTYYFKKSYSIPRPAKLRSVEVEDAEEKPRESIKSTNSQDDGTIVFGSDRQMSFMSKLNNIFQNKISSEGEEQRRRSNSTGDMVDNATFAMNRERPSLFQDLMNELTSIQSTPNLRSVVAVESEPDSEKEEGDDLSMNRHDLKSKLENIFATGGPKPPSKTRPMKSNPPTPEEAYQTDASSTESISKLPKMEKNDTLKRQKDKFGAVLNSFRLSLNKDDNVV